MSKINKAKKMVKNYLDTTDGLVNPYDVPEVMIEFAKLHVQAALEEASKVTLPYDFEEEIKNAYPLKNIK